MRGKIVGFGEKAEYFVEGVRVTKEEFRRLMPPPQQTVTDQLPFSTGVKPHPSDALAVHPDQVQEATLDAIKKGVPTEFLPDGRPIMRSRAHQKEYIRAYGWRNNDGGYGD